MGAVSAIADVASDVVGGVADAVSDVGSSIDDFVNDNIPGGWIIPVAVATAGALGGLDGILAADSGMDLAADALVGNSLGDIQAALGGDEFIGALFDPATSTGWADVPVSAASTGEIVGPVWDGEEFITNMVDPFESLPWTDGPVDVASTNEVYGPVWDGDPAPIFDPVIDDLPVNADVTVDVDPTVTDTIQVDTTPPDGPADVPVDVAPDVPPDVPDVPPDVPVDVTPTLPPVEDLSTIAVDTTIPTLSDALTGGLVGAVVGSELTDLLTPDIPAVTSTSTPARINHPNWDMKFAPHTTWKDAPKFDFQFSDVPEDYFFQAQMVPTDQQFIGVGGSPYASQIVQALRGKSAGLASDNNGFTLFQTAAGK